MTITLRDTATAGLHSLGARLRSPALRRAIGQGAANVVRAHFDTLEQRPQKEGWWKKNAPGPWPKTHFWSRASRSVNVLPPDPLSVRVAISALGVRQRLLGGDLTPQNGGQTLTIPVRPEAYGKRAREFPNLRLAIRTIGGKAKVVGLETQTGTERGAVMRQNKSGKWTRRRVLIEKGALLYWFVRKVTQPADPTVMPSESRLAAGAEAGAADFLASL